MAMYHTYNMSHISYMRAHFYYEYLLGRAQKFNDLQKSHESIHEQHKALELEHETNLVAHSTLKEAHLELTRDHSTLTLLHEALKAKHEASSGKSLLEHTQKVAELTEQNQDLQEKHVEAKTSLSNLTEIHATLCKQYSDTANELDDALVSKQDLEQELESLKANKAAPGPSHDELSLAEEKLAEVTQLYKDNLEELDQVQECYTTMEKEYRDHLDETAGLDEDVNRLQEELKSLRHEKGQQEASLMSMEQALTVAKGVRPPSELEATLEKKTRECYLLQQDLDELQLEKDGVDQMYSVLIKNNSQVTAAHQRLQQDHEAKVKSIQEAGEDSDNKKQQEIKALNQRVKEASENNVKIMEELVKLTGIFNPTNPDDPPAYLL